MTTKQIHGLNSLLTKLVRIRQKERCLRCGKKTILSASHIYPKGTYRKMRFMPKNVKGLCYNCHMNFWHKDVIKAHEWLEKVYPKETLDELKKLANTIIKTPLDYYKIKEELENEINKYE